MPMYALSFDLDTVAMDEDGFSKSQKVQVYQQEIPAALKACGFSMHPQGSLYHTELNTDDPLSALVSMRSTLQSLAPNFCMYARNVKVFRMDDWSDVTDVLRLPRPEKASVLPFTVNEN